MNKNLSVQFNSPIKDLDPSEVTIRETVAQTRKGVSEVVVAKDGMSAQITLVGGDNVRGLDANTEYTMSVTQNGKVTSFSFQIPGVLENFVVSDIDSENRTVEVTKQNATTNGAIVFKSLNVPKDMAFDFKELEGRELVIWFDKDDNITKYNTINQTIVYGSIEIITENNKDYVKLVGQDKQYQLENAGNIESRLIIDGNRVVEYSNATHAALTAEYAKVVLRSNGKVDFIVADKLNNSILVEKVTGNYVQSYGNEVNFKDYTITKDGKTITIVDLKANDVVYYNTTTKTADVFNNTVTGKIDNVYLNEFKLGNKIYSFATGVQTIIGGRLVTLDNDNIASFDKDVVLHTNRKGELVYLTGEQGEVVSNTGISYLTKVATGYDFRADKFIKLETQTADGEKVIEDIEVSKLTKLQTGTKVYQTSKPNANEAGNIWIEEFTLNATNANFAGKTMTASGATTANTDLANETVAQFAEKGLVEVTKDAKGIVVGLSIQTAGDLAADVTLEAKALKVLAKDYLLAGSTPVFIQNTDGTIVSTTWAKLDSSITKIKTTDGTNKTLVYTEAVKNTVKYVVIPQGAIEGQATEETVEAIVSDVRYNTKNEIAYLSLVKDGVAKEYTLDFSKTANKTLVLNIGDVVKVDLDNSDKVRDIQSDSENPETGVLTNLNTLKRSFDINGTTFTGASTGFEVYEVTGTGSNKKVVKRELSDLDNLAATKEVTVSRISAASDYVDFIVIKEITTGVADTTPPVITINVGNQDVKVSDVSTLTAPTATATDAVDGSVTATISKVESTISSVTTTETNFAAAVAKGYTAGDKIVVTFTATDAAGNVATETVTYTVIAD